MAQSDDDDGFKFAPGALESIETIIAKYPESASSIREQLAGMRQAHEAWKAGRYATFEDACEAILGSRPTPVEE